jgi:hypothetical protein
MATHEIEDSRASRIAARAYELYEARGGVDGSDLRDWLDAEREIDQERVTDTDTIRAQDVANTAPLDAAQPRSGPSGRGEAERRDRPAASHRRAKDTEERVTM